MKFLLALLATMAFTGTTLAEPGSIAGTVVDNRTGEPIANALVSARGENGGSSNARTNERGNYRIADLRPDRYHAAAEARGYELAGYPRAVVVRSGQAVSEISFRLRPVQTQAGAIAGRITDARTNEPIPYAAVVAAGRPGEARTRADDHGNYAVRGLKPGSYKVVAKARFHAATAYPEPVRVEAGQVTREINLQLKPRLKHGAIAGRVVDAHTRRPIAGALVVAQGERGGGKTRTDARGCYRIGRLNPDKYRVAAAKPGYEPAAFPRPVPVRPGEVTKGIDFALARRNVDHD
jgi:uncharacterized surface anchored protein